MRHVLPVAVASTALALALAVALVPTSSRSQEAQKSAQPARSAELDDARVAELLEGRWTLARGEEAARQTLERAIERTTDGMFPIVRGQAQRQLREANPINGAVEFHFTPQRIRAVFESGTYESAPGQSIQTRQPGSGDEMQLVQLVRDGHLEQVFTTGNGRRWSVFTPTPDGQTMKMQVTIQAGILPRPLQYEIDYRRAQ